MLAMLAIRLLVVSDFFKSRGGISHSDWIELYGRLWFISLPRPGNSPAALITSAENHKIKFHFIISQQKKRLTSPGITRYSIDQPIQSITMD